MSKLAAPGAPKGLPRGKLAGLGRLGMAAGGLLVVAKAAKLGKNGPW